MMAADMMAPADLAKLRSGFLANNDSPEDHGRPYCDHCGHENAAELTLSEDEMAEMGEHIDPAVVAASAPFGGYTTSASHFTPTEAELASEHPDAYRRWLLAKATRANRRMCADGKACSVRRAARFPARPEAHLPDWVRGLKPEVKHAGEVRAAAVEEARAMFLSLSGALADAAGPPEPPPAPPAPRLVPAMRIDLNDPLLAIRGFGGMQPGGEPCPDPKLHQAPRGRGRPARASRAPAAPRRRGRRLGRPGRGARRCAGTRLYSPS
jgi:hypothetical protein